MNELFASINVALASELIFDETEEVKETTTESEEVEDEAHISS